MFPFDRCVHLFPPSLQWVPWPLLAEPCASPPSSVLWVRKTARPPVRVRLWSPLAIALPLLRAGMASSPGFLGNPFGNMPRASDSGDFGPPFAIAVVPDTAFRHFNDVGYRHDSNFGAESSRPASLLCTLRTHQSPGEWQHSLPACSLALAGRDSHPLDFIKWFPYFITGSSTSTLIPARSVGA